MACIHGYEPADCLICQTLEPGSRRSRTRARAGRDAPAVPAPVEVVRPRVVTADGARPSRRWGLHVGALVVVLVVAAISVWFVASAVFALLHLLEIVLVAAVAGTLGYRIGRSRGRRDR